jgi:hypothetical protein
MPRSEMGIPISGRGNLRLNPSFLVVVNSKLEMVTVKVSGKKISLVTSLSHPASLDFLQLAKTRK